MAGLWDIEEVLTDEEDANAYLTNGSDSEDDGKWAELDIAYDDMAAQRPRSVHGPDYLETPFTSVYQEILENPKYDPNYGKNYQYNYIDNEGFEKMKIFTIDPNFRPPVPTSEIPKVMTDETPSQVSSQVPELAKSTSKRGRYCKCVILFVGIFILVVLAVAGVLFTLQQDLWLPRSVHGPDYPASRQLENGLHRIENPKYGQDYSQHYNYADDNPSCYEEPHANNCPSIPVSQVPQSPPKTLVEPKSFCSKYWMYFVIGVGVLIILAAVGVTVVLLMTKNNGHSIATSTVGPVQTTSQSSRSTVQPVQTSSGNFQTNQSSQTTPQFVQTTSGKFRTTQSPRTTAQPVQTTSNSIPTTKPSDPCKSNFRLPSPEATKCWSIFDGIPFPYFAAKVACSAMDSHLATVKSAEENEWMVDFMGKLTKTWIGLHCDSNDAAECEWEDGSNLEGYNNFENENLIMNTDTIFDVSGVWHSVPSSTMTFSYTCETDRIY